MSKHGYFLTRLGAPEHFLAITPAGTDWTTDIHAASRFERWRDAYHQSLALMMNDGPVVEIVERTIPDEPAADTNPEDKTARSRDEVVAEMKKQAAEYYAQHGHKVPLRNKGYGRRRFGGGRLTIDMSAGFPQPADGSVTPLSTPFSESVGRDGEAANPSMGKAPELNAPGAEAASAPRPTRPTWPLT